MIITILFLLHLNGKYQVSYQISNIQHLSMIKIQETLTMQNMMQNYRSMGNTNAKSNTGSGILKRVEIKARRVSGITFIMCAHSQICL